MHQALPRLLTIVVLCLSACQPEVLRIHDGSTLASRPIAAEAYATFMQARLLELNGNWHEAVALYEDVIRLDGQAVEAWTRLGALKCTRNAPDSRGAFANAARLDSESSALWLAKCQCDIAQSRYTEAVDAGRRALSISPDDPQISLALVQALLRNHQQTEGAALAWALVAEHPRSKMAWELLRDVASLSEKGPIDQALIQNFNRSYTSAPSPDNTATNAITDDFRWPQETAPSTISRTPALIDAMLSNTPGSVDRAARGLKLTALRLSMLAYTLGAFEVAKTEALRAYRAGPDNANAWALALVSAELLHDSDTVSLLLERGVPPGAHLTPSIASAVDAMLWRQSAPESAPAVPH